MRHCAATILLILSRLPAAGGGYAAIHVVDDATGSGVPLMELRTVSEQRFVSDNAGWIALSDPDLLGQTAWFHVSGPGYEVAKDGFGYAGLRLCPLAGGVVEIRVRRTQPAERLGRQTGRGRFRDSLLLGKTVPPEPENPFPVTGQDSVQAVPFGKGIFWLWGDTSVVSYPLGNFHTTCAVSNSVPDERGGFRFRYFTDQSDPGRLRRMMPRDGNGVVWMQGLVNVPDKEGRETLVAHWGRFPGLAPVIEQGIAVFRAEDQTFQSVAGVPKEETWRFPRGHAVREGDWIYFASPLPHTRVRADLGDLSNPESYEALWFDPVARRWTWQREHAPTTQKEEADLLKAGTVAAADARFDLRDPAGNAVAMHGGSVRWNAHRQRWIFLGVATGGKDAPSFLGEVWYAESRSPDGPWSRTVKVASHPRYSFYNPVHHSFMDQRNGQIIHFEGTWSAEFSGNPLKTPRYDYNQILYRLDLNHPGLDPAQP